MSLRFLTVWGRFEWIILAVSIAHFISFLFCSKLPEKRYGVRTIAAERPPPPLQASKLLAGPPFSPQNVRTLWITPLNPDLSLSFHCTKNEEILNGKLHFYAMFVICPYLR